MSIIFQIFSKNKASIRAVGHIFRRNLENTRHFLSIIYLRAKVSPYHVH